MDISQKTLAGRFKTQFPRVKKTLQNAPRESQEIIADSFLTSLATHDEPAGKLADIAARTGKLTNSQSRGKIYNLAFKALSNSVDAASTSLPGFVSQVIGTIPKGDWLVDPPSENLSTTLIADLRPHIQPESPQQELLGIVESKNDDMLNGGSLEQLKPELNEPLGLPAAGREALYQSREELSGIKALADVMGDDYKGKGRTETFLGFAANLPDKDDAKKGEVSRESVFNLLAEQELSKQDQIELFRFADKHSSKDALKAFGRSTKNEFYQGLTEFGLKADRVDEAVTHLKAYKSSESSPREALKAVMLSVQNEEDPVDRSSEFRLESPEWELFQEPMSWSRSDEDSMPTPQTARYQVAHDIWMRLTTEDLNRG